MYEMLVRGESYVARPREDPQHWLNDPENWHSEDRPNLTLAAYDWLCGQMEQRGMARPAPDAYPVWAFQQWAGPHRPRPDLRTSSLKNWAAGSRSVLLTLEVPADAVLLSDYDAWHSALNYWYLARPGRANAFDRLCKSRGASYYRQKPLKDQELHQQVLDSWQQIFDLPALPRLMEFKKRDQVVQGTFWTLAPHHVVEAVEFGAGRPKARLPAPPTEG